MENNYWVIIPAAGMGARFSREIPKQYLKIQDKTLLQYSLERFIDKKGIKKVIVPIGKHDTFFGQMPCAFHPKVVSILGGDERMDSVMNALHYLKNVAQNHDWVLVHDAVRCCLHDEDLNNLVQTLQHNEVGGLLCSKVTDTIKFCQKAQVLHTVDRTPLWQALTPQMFRFDKLYQAYEQCIAKGISITDDASAIEHCGLSPLIVEAKHPNPKLTYLKDLDLFNAILSKYSLSEEGVSCE